MSCFSCDLNNQARHFPQESDDPMAYIHFTAEGEVTFKSILFVPTSAPRGLFDEYGSKKSDYIKVDGLFLSIMN
jgi:heat shock protein beta